MNTKITILGCGTSTGIPVIGCSCTVCKSSNPKNQRSRASLWVEKDGLSFIIDTSTDFRSQVLRNKVPRVDAVFITHAHADHIHGIDDLRSYNFLQREEIPVFIDDAAFVKMEKYFDYIFCQREHVGFVPQLVRKKLESKIYFKGLEINSFPMQHGSGFTQGLRFDNFAYCTDVKVFPKSSLKQLENLDLLILDMLRFEEHPTHLCFKEAMEIVEKVKPRRTIFTHMSHEIDYEILSQELPENIELAYDNKVTVL